MAAGGAERQAALLCNHWVREGHDLTLATLSGAASHYDLNPAIIRRYLRKAQGSDLRNIRALIGAEKPDVIVSFMDTVNVKVLAAAIGSAIPVIISERSIPSSALRTNSLLRGIVITVLKHLLYPLAAALVVQTAAVARWARRWLLARRIDTISNIVAEMPFCGPRLDEPLILSVGRLSHEKGHDILIRAFALIAVRFPGWRLRIVGDGVLREELQALILSLGLEKSVELAPVQKDVAIEYARAGIFVLPSRFEGFPNALIEAMQAGCAVIAADCPCAPREILRNGIDGLLFRNGDDGNLAERLAGLMADSTQRRTLGEQASRTAKNYSPELILPRWDGLLKSVVQAGQRR